MVLSTRIFCYYRDALLFNIARGGVNGVENIRFEPVSET